MRKGSVIHFAHFPNFHFKTLTMYISVTTCIAYYTRYELQAPQTSSLGRASELVDSIRNHRFMPHFGSSSLGIGGLL